MRQSPLSSGVFYTLLGILFTYLAVRNVAQDGWGIFSYLLILLATFDLGSGIRLIFLHFRIQNMNKK